MKTLRGCNFELLFIQNGSFYPKEKTLKQDKNRSFTPLLIQHELN